MTRKLSVAMLLAALALPASAQALPPLSKGVIVSNANSYELAGTFSKTGAGRELFSPGIVTGDVATGDFNDDGTDDLAFGSFGDAAPRAIVLDGRTRANLLTLTPQKSDAGGVRVGVGDLNGDGRADLATAPAAGPGPVRVYDGTTGAILRAFYPYGQSFNGGVSVALGDVDGDGRDDVVTSTLSQTVHVKAFSGATNATLRSFFAFEGTSSYDDGADVAVGNVDGDWREDIVLMSQAGWSSLVQIWDVDGFVRGFSLGKRWHHDWSLGDSWFGAVDIGNLDTDSAPELVFGGNYFLPEILVYDNGVIFKRFVAFPDWAHAGAGVAVQRVSLLG